MRAIYWFCWFCCLALNAGKVFAYDPLTHRALSEEAARTSIIADADSLFKRGFPPIFDGVGAKTFPNSKTVPGTILSLISDGAEFEDDTPRSINHFFDPRTGSPLHIIADDYVTSDDSVTVQTYLSGAVAAVNAVAVTSPDWALGTLPLSHLSQTYSYADLRKYYFQALTSTSGANRLLATGLTFETLGRIVHHLQDMAAPQHVRNDAHLQLETADAHCPASPVTFFWGLWCPVYARLRAPSTYESWTTAVQETNGYRLPLTGYDTVYGADFNGAPAFVQARDFWISNGRGIAEFTNRNFLSPGTMAISPPSLGTPFTMKVADLCADAMPACQVTYDADDAITFYSSTVDDQLRPNTGGPNPFAATDSIFSWDLKQYRPGRGPERTVNRFTFAYDHAYLLPRAVAYSAGLINYFFRGDMKIEPPEEGVYAIVDHGADGCGTPCGFRKVKFKLTNMTPGVVNGSVTPGAESMGVGTLWAVAKYHLNTCYQPDLSGEYGAPNFTGNGCRSTDESIAVSQPLAVSAVGGPSDGPLTPTFYFDDLHPIPINASDVYLQAVFRGKLGQEDDAVAVATVDISEPNFYALENMTDYIFDPALQQYFPLPYKNYVYPVSVTNVRVAFGVNDAHKIATLDTLDAGHYAQFATLMERGRTLFSEDFNTQNYYPYETLDGVPFDAEEFTTDDAGPYAGQYTRTCPVGSIRGMFRQYDSFFHMEVVDHRGGGVALKKGSVRSSNTESAASPEAVPTKAAVASDCGALQTTGFYNFSSMPRFTQANAVPWQINF